jgi:predicted nuclease with TOPRIM domain
MKIFGQEIDVPKEFESVAKLIENAAQTEITNQKNIAANYTQDISLKKIADLLGLEKEERENIKIKDAWQKLTTEVESLKAKIETKPDEKNDNTSDRIKELEAKNAALEQKMETEKNTMAQQMQINSAYNDIISAAGMIGLVETEKKATMRDIKDLFGVDFKNGQAFFLNNDNETPMPIMDGDKYANVEKLATIVKEKFPRRFEEVKSGFGGFSKQKGQTPTVKEGQGQSWSEEMASVHP